MYPLESSSPSMVPRPSCESGFRSTGLADDETTSSGSNENSETPLSLVSPAPSIHRATSRTPSAAASHRPLALPPPPPAPPSDASSQQSNSLLNAAMEAVNNYNSDDDYPEAAGGGSDSEDGEVD